MNERPRNLTRREVLRTGLFASGMLITAGGTLTAITEGLSYPLARAKEVSNNPPAEDNQDRPRKPQIELRMESDNNPVSKSQSDKHLDNAVTGLVTAGVGLIVSFAGIEPERPKRRIIRRVKKILRPNS